MVTLHLEAVDVRGGQAIFRSRNVWHLIRLDDGWVPQRLIDRQDALQHVLHGGFEAASGKYGSLEELVSAVRDMWVSEMDIPDVPLKDIEWFFTGDAHRTVESATDESKVRPSGPDSSSRTRTWSEIAEVLAPQLRIARDWGVSDDLVAAAAGGSRSALDILLARTRPWILQLVMARLSPSPRFLDACEEITQDVMIATFLGIEGLRPPTVLAFKMRTRLIVSSHVAAALGSTAKMSGAYHNIAPAASLDLLLQAVSKDEGPLQHVIASEARERGLLELGRLDKDKLEILTLVFFEGLTTREVAMTIGINRAAVEMRLLRAINSLRDRLSESL